MRVAVIGSGYVGLVAGVCFAELGHDVVVVDNDPEKLAALRNGEVPIYEQNLPELLSRHRGKRLAFCGDTSEAVSTAQAVFIAVGTPPLHNGDADLSYVETVARDISRAVKSYTVVVDKSTVPVYTSDWVRKVMLLNGADKRLFDVASNPEFLREGTAVVDFLYPDRIVVGVESSRSADVLSELYRPLTDGSYYNRPDRIPGPISFRGPAKIIYTSPRSAELIKHASNAFLALKISFINAVANVCEEVGADIEEVRRGIGSDDRIGMRFLHPGIGYGGSCFPKDVSAFRSVAREHGYDFRLLKEVMTINDDQRQRFMQKIRKTLWTLKGKRIGVLGLAFKDGTDDIRESPAIAIVQELVAEGCQVTAYDPAAMTRASQVLPGAVMFASSAYDVAEDKDALLVLTDWQGFRLLDLRRLHDALRYPIVIDGRNLFSLDEMRRNGFLYVSVGRPDAMPSENATSELHTAERAAVSPV